MKPKKLSGAQNKKRRIEKQENDTRIRGSLDNFVIKIPNSTIQDSQDVIEVDIREPSCDSPPETSSSLVEGKMNSNINITFTLIF